MENKPAMDPAAFMEEVVNKNSELLERLEKDTEFKNWYETFQQNQEINAALNQDLLAMLLADEYIPGEQADSDFTFLNNRFQAPFNSVILRNAGKTEAARLIKNTRSLQFTSYGRPSLKKNEPGLAINFIDPDYKPTPIEKENLKQFTYNFVDKFFFCPFEEKGNLMKWLGAAYNDFFDLDDITFEIRRTFGKKPLGFHLTDPTMVYHVLPKGKSYERWDLNEDSYLKKQAWNVEDRVKYVLEKNHVRLAGFTSDRMVKSHFFVATDYMQAYKGFSIVEQGIRMLLNIMNSITYNSSNFNNNRTPMGVFAFTGGFTNRIVTEQFKKILYSYLSGANNRYRLPVIGLPERGDAKFIPFNSNSREMEFHLWMTLLFTILSQLSGTNPEELSMSSHEAAMVGKKLFDQSPDGILQVSKDKGLNTFLRYIESIINKTGVLKQMTGYNVICKFNGLEVEDQRLKIELRKMELGTNKSYNDLIIEEGGEPQQLMYGDVNVYDVIAPESTAVWSTLQARVQAQQEEKARLQTQAGMAENGENPEMTEGDNKLVNQYGKPEVNNENTQQANVPGVQKDNATQGG